MPPQRVSPIFLELVRQKMRLLGLSRSQLAARAGVDPGTVTKVLDRRLASSTAVPKIRAALGIQYDAAGEMNFEVYRRGLELMLVDIMVGASSQAEQFVDGVDQLAYLHGKAASTRMHQAELLYLIRAEREKPPEDQSEERLAGFLGKLASVEAEMKTIGRLMSKTTKILGAFSPDQHWRERLDPGRDP